MPSTQPPSPYVMVVRPNIRQKYPGPRSNPAMNNTTDISQAISVNPPTTIDTSEYPRICSIDLVRFPTSRQQCLVNNSARSTKIAFVTLGD